MRLLELNDLGLRLFEGERLLLDSPGHAALDGKRLLTGAAARARARLDPRRSHDRYWYQLDATLPAPLGSARSAADLAHAQLLELREPLCAAPLLLAAPASFTPAQLGVLLGLLEAIGARAVGLVDAAVAAACSLPTRANVLHLDLQQHRMVCTWMEGADVLQRTRIEELKPGASGLQDRCAAVIAQAFVRHARFDPLHSASTEQALYAQLPDWMAQLAHTPSVTLELASGGRTHRVSLAREALHEALAEPLQELLRRVLPAVQARQASVLLSDRAAAVPGLANQLPGSVELSPAAVALGAAAHHERIVGDSPELAWITRLPRRAPLHAAPASPRDSARQPTHALCGARARALPARGANEALAAWLPGAPGLLRHDESGLRLEHASTAVRLNGEPMQGTRALRAGDRLSFDGQDLLLIVVD